MRDLDPNVGELYLAEGPETIATIGIRSADELEHHFFKNLLQS